MSILVRVASILLLAVVCCRAPQTDAAASEPPDAIEDPASGAPADQTAKKVSEKPLEDPILPRIALLTPSSRDHDLDHTIMSREPFDLQLTEALPNEVVVKWADLQSRIRSEEETLAACRAGSSDCSGAVRQFLQIIELGRQHHGRAKLGVVNRAVNLSIKPASDWAQYGVEDFWATPLATLGAGAGDCEDYAIVKYVALREAGIVSDDLRVMIVRDTKRKTDHAVLAVRLGEEWLILDNRTLIMVSADDARQYYPLFVLDHRGVRVPQFASTAALPRF